MSLPREAIAAREPFAVTTPEDRVEALVAVSEACWIAIRNFGPGSVEVITSRGRQKSLVPARESEFSPLVLHPGSEVELYRQEGESIYLSLNPDYGSEPACGWCQRRGELTTS